MDNFIQFLMDILDDDHGISSDAYHSLCEYLDELVEKGKLTESYVEKLDNAISATEGRYYMDSEDAREMIRLFNED